MSIHESIKCTHGRTHWLTRPYTHQRTQTCTRQYSFGHALRDSSSHRYLGHIVEERETVDDVPTLLPEKKLYALNCVKDLKQRGVNVSWWNRKDTLQFHIHVDRFRWNRDGFLGETEKTLQFHIHVDRFRWNRAGFHDEIEKTHSSSTFVLKDFGFAQRISSTHQKIVWVQNWTYDVTANRGCKQMKRRWWHSGKIRNTNA